MIRVRPTEHGDRPWVVRRLEEAFGDVTVARKGVLADASVLPGFVATDGGRPVGLLTYYAAHGACEVVAIISTEEGRGIGRALMDAVHDHAAAAGYRRLWLITTNDNSRAFRFYQLWGMDLCAFYPAASGWTTNSSSSCPWAAQSDLIGIAPEARAYPEGKKGVTYSLEIPCGYRDRGHAACGLPYLSERSVG